MVVEEIKKNLGKDVKVYINAIKEEYNKYIPIDVLNKLNNIKDYEDIIKIYDYGTINAFATDDYIAMPLCAYKVIDKMSRMIGYGFNKKDKLYDDIINNNTFFTYVKHVFISGTNIYEYYSDLLLHEVMHFCGSGGSNIIQEGINELLTRMVAKKYNFRTNYCAYFKEVKLVYELMQVFGEEIIIQLAFINDLDEQLLFLKRELGNDASELYYNVYYEANKEFMSKYYCHMNEFSGIKGMFKKILFYKKLNYNKAYKLIKQYYLVNKL